MFVERGDRVVLIAANQDHLVQHIGSEWVVENVLDIYHPASALIRKVNLQALVYIRFLEVKPPKDSPFPYNHKVRIKNNKLKVSGPYHLMKHLSGMVGEVRGYDRRYDVYCIKTPDGQRGWFSMDSLLPTDFKGDHFFYPLDKVFYHGQIKQVMEVRMTRFRSGQLLKIDGEWVPSSSVEVA